MYLAPFIEQSHLASSIEELSGMFCDVLGHLGYGYYCCYTLNGLLPDTHKPVGQAQRIHYNASFVEEYQSNRYLEQDPMFNLMCRARGPFTWQQVMQLPLTARQDAIMQARKRAGSHGGIGIPLQSCDPMLIGICIMGARPNPPTDSKTLSQIYAVSNEFQLQRARLFGTTQALLPDIRLTPREREMLEWAAQGKSNGVIASILDISEKTVEFHFKSIFTKLNVSSRTTAVLKAVHMRLINMTEWA